MLTFAKFSIEANLQDKTVLVAGELVKHNVFFQLGDQVYIRKVLLR